jgi:uncharacterized protein (DUF3820 family)
MDTQTLPLVPFGKYKGQPITSLMNDTKYLEWCKQQEWFQKFPIVYNICVNQTIQTSNQNSKTPEHNKLQILFSDNRINTIKLIRRVIFNSNGPIPKNPYCYDYKVICEGRFNWDIIIENLTIYKCVCEEGYTTCSECDNSNYYRDIYIEIKPLLGEDYPDVKRKMDIQISLTNNNNNDKKHFVFGDKKHFVLLIKEFNATSATKEQLIKYFDSSDIKVVFISELFDILPSQIITEQVEQIQDITIQPSHQQETEEENKLLREKLLQAEEKIKQLEEELLSYKSQKQSKSIKDYFGKK